MRLTCITPLYEKYQLTTKERLFLPWSNTSYYHFRDSEVENYDLNL